MKTELSNNSHFHCGGDVRQHIPTTADKGSDWANQIGEVLDGDSMSVSVALFIVMVLVISVHDGNRSYHTHL